MSEKKERWQEALGEMFAPERYAAADVAPREAPPSDLRLPDVSIESRGPGNPAIEGGYGYGDAELRGGYQKRNQYSPAEWKAMLGYRRSF